MKSVIFLVLIVVTITLALDESHNGRPCCQTELELSQKFWRNNFDSTVYFECVTRNQPAEWRKCPEQFLFFPPKGQCVPLADWVWTPAVDAPSKC